MSFEACQARVYEDFERIQKFLRRLSPIKLISSPRLRYAPETLQNRHILPECGSLDGHLRLLLRLSNSSGFVPSRMLGFWCLTWLYSVSRSCFKHLDMMSNKGDWLQFINSYAGCSKPAWNLVKVSLVLYSIRRLQLDLSC